ncbi:hypothetical protein SAMN04488121_11296 [Chitinophaga filiformis]|uniref:Uncharacterized protein n=1 Tax=Chitinophaga filiformis TaxID=104663 RepID=A0A1G8CCJ7_CHIFI|nr:hypothetical protein SAMN04488121_11296 [Chitinophaga filiformis]
MMKVNLPSFCLAWGLAFYCSCNTVDRRTVLHIPIKEKGVVINVDYVAVGATSKDVMQIIRFSSDGKSEVLKNLEVYDTILSYNLRDDTTLSLIFCDTVFMSRPQKLDTINVRIN